MELPAYCLLILTRRLRRTLGLARDAPREMLDCSPHTHHNHLAGRPFATGNGMHLSVRSVEPTCMSLCLASSSLHSQSVTGFTAYWIDLKQDSPPRTFTTKLPSSAGPNHTSRFVKSYGVFQAMATCSPDPVSDRIPVGGETNPSCAASSNTCNAAIAMNKMVGN